MKIKNRIWSWMLILVMLVSLVPFSTTATAAAEDVVIGMEENWAAAGSSVKVDISITGNPGIIGGTLTVSWPEGLTLIDDENGTAFDGITYQAPSRYVSAGTNFVWYGSDVEDILDGTILSLTFEVDENAVDSDKYLISVSGKGFTDSNQNAVDVLFVSDYIRIVNYVPGDVSGDDQVAPLDLVLLARYISDGCVTDPEGYNVTLNEAAADVNDDGELAPMDLILISRYISDGCVTDPDGYNITLKPSTPKCQHTGMEATAAKEPSCTETGNIAYWYCSECEKYFSDENGTKEISLENTILQITHAVVVDPAVAPTYTTTGLTEGSHCALCKKVIVAQEIVPVLTYEYSITYNIAGSDSYLAAQEIDNSSNPTGYDSAVGTDNLVSLTAPAGYTFLGWFDAPQENAGATQVRKITAGSTGNETLYAHWQEIEYDITYKLYQTPLGAITDEKYLTYTVSKGLVDLPNPELYNYVFLGWYTDDGAEMTRIPAGTTGDITLNAYWTSKRNLAKAVKSLDDPIVIENSEEGAIYFAYEIGTIENVPLSDAIWTIQSVSGLAQQQEKTVTVETSESRATSIAETISDTTVDSATWTLSEDWNEVTEVSEEWAEENGMSVVEANEITKSSSGTYSFTDSNGGSDTTTDTDGTTTVDYDSQNKTHGNAAEFNAKVGGSYSNEGNLSSKVAGTFEVSAEISGGYKQHQETNEHTGTDKTTVDTTVKEGETHWNKSSTSSQTKAQSESESVSRALSSIISNTKGYGQSYSAGGENSESQGFSSTNSKSVNSSSTLTYSTAKTETTTSTYSTDGKSEGCYRLVIAGKVHVFAVVGYDVATMSYFTYTYNVVDDDTYEFLDYSPTLSFDDYENCALPFEVPYFVYEYVSEKTLSTSGLVYRTDTANKTAMVVGYEGTDTDVTIPSYFSASNTSYKVTGLSASAFAGKNIRSVILSDYITELPAGAFKDCAQLEEISGFFTVIGDNAFSGCTSLDKFTVSPSVTEIGANAFAGTGELRINALDARSALAAAQAKNPELDSIEDADELQSIAQTITQNVIDAAINSGAQNIILDISDITEGTVLTLNVPEIASFELHGGQKSYDDLKLVSKAEMTVLKEITIHNCTRIPLEISSETLKLDAASVEGPGFVLLLSATNPKISLTRDNRLMSVEKEAVVWRNPIITAEVVDSTLGVLDVTGNIYVYGDITGQDNLTVSDGEIIHITESDFENYIKGVYAITFNANGGQVDTEEMTVFYGSAFGTLPIPTRDYYTFDGWFTEDGTEVTADTVMTEAKDISLTAHWTQNGASGWVLASEVPADAEIVNQKWTYDLTTNITSSSESVSGYTLYNTTWKWGSYGSWSSWSKTKATASDSRQVETKTVTDQEGYTNYHYYIYRDNNHYYFGSQGWNNCYNYYELNLNYALSCVDSSLGLYGYCVGSCGHSNCNRWFSGGSWWVPAVTHTEYRYRDRSKVYTYYHTKTEAKESATAITASDTISNVQKWVQYRAK